jgi:hypothetical protein
MPTYRSQVTPEQLNLLVEYIKALAPAKASTTRPADDGSLPNRLPDLPPSQDRPNAQPSRNQVIPR